MLEVFGLLSLGGLIIFIGFNIIYPLICVDRSKIWSPIVFISLVYFYYTIWPYFWGDTDIFGLKTQGTTEYNLIAAFISYLGVNIAFYNKNKYTNLKKINGVFTENNGIRLSLLLFLIGFVGYVSIKGFSMSIFASGDSHWVKGGDFAFYFTDLISLFCVSCSILVAQSKRKWMIIGIILISLYFYILCGFRYRIVMLAIAVFTTWHLFPLPKKINFKLLIPIGLAAYLLFAVMDGARRYGAGLDREAVKNFDIRKSGGASENSSVFSFTGYTIVKSMDQEMVLFEPFWCALTMPIPRALYPDKPNAEYIRKISTYEFGGAAFMYYAEAYMAFGWCGVLLYGLFIGCLSRVVWNNYRTNYNNINAILFLAVFNGVTYVMISRGYMAQVFQTFIYFVMLPFWIARFIKFVYPQIK